MTRRVGQVRRVGKVRRVGQVRRVGRVGGRAERAFVGGLSFANCSLKLR